jgi:hypothetical protein
VDRTRRRSIQEAVHDLDEAFLHCRDYSHKWDPWDATDDGPVVIRILQCGRCGAMRRQLISRRTGLVLPGTNRIIYPKGYGIRGLGYLDAADRGLIRLASTEADRRHKR